MTRIALIEYRPQFAPVNTRYGFQVGEPWMRTGREKVRLNRTGFSGQFFVARLDPVEFKNLFQLVDVN